jgi:DNA primase
VRVADDAVMLELDRAIPPGAAREPQLQAKAATAVAELLRPIPDAVVRHGYARLAAQRLDIPVEMLARRAAGGDSLEKKLERRMPGSSAGSVETAGSAPSLVRSLEEQVLERLIQGEELLPALEELPPPEVFFDTECRNIYQAFRALYAEGMGSRPEVRALQERLGYEGRSVDRMARILLEGSFAPGRTGLLVSLENLARRWKEQRLRELVREINEAQQRGLDPESLARLYQEKRTLSLSIHRRSRPGANEGFP